MKDKDGDFLKYGVNGTYNDIPIFQHVDNPNGIVLTDECIANLKFDGKPIVEKEEAIGYILKRTKQDKKYIYGDVVLFSDKFIPIGFKNYEIQCEFENDMIVKEAEIKGISLEFEQ